MTISTRVNGVWRGVEVPWVKVNGVWKPVDVAYAKSSGKWNPAFQFDAPPPPRPSITIINQDNRFIDVSVSVAEVGHQTDIKRIRVLVAVGGDAYPATPQSKGFYSAPNTAGGVEPWSDFFYNNLGVGTDGRQIFDGRQTNQPSTKRFAPTYREGAALRASTYYRFTAFVEDKYGRWSTGTTAALKSAKKVGKLDDDVYHTVSIQPEAVGTFNTETKVFTEGEGYVGIGKMAQLYYGGKIRAAVPLKVADLSASVFIARKGADHGPPAMRFFAGWHASDRSVALEPAELPNAGSSVTTITRGQSVRKVIPSAWETDIAARSGSPKVADMLQGINVRIGRQDTVNTQGVLQSQAAAPDQGTLVIRWKD